MAKRIRFVTLLLVLVSLSGRAQTPRYELLLRGGHLIDPRNNISANRDIAISAGKIAAVAPQIDPSNASRLVKWIHLCNDFSRPFFP